MTRFPFRPAVGALALAAAGACAAQSSVSLYGLVDVAGGRFQNAGGLKTWRIDANGMSQSYLGLRVIEDVGAGLKVRVQLEHYLRPDTGTAGRYGADPFWSRSANVGFQGAFGTSLLGRNTTPLYQSTVLLSAFGDSFAFSPTLRQYFGSPGGGSVGDTIVGDIVWNNSLAYASPDHNGVSFNLIGNLGEGAVGATGRNLGGNIVYLRGPLAATVAWQQVRNGATALPAGFQHQNTVHVGLAYEFGPAKVFGQLGRIKTDAAIQADTQLWQIGSAIPVGQTGLARIAYGSREVDSGGLTLTNRTFAVGYDHYLSKSTDLYGAIVFDRSSGLASGRTFAGGMRLRF